MTEDDYTDLQKEVIKCLTSITIRFTEEEGIAVKMGYVPTDEIKVRALWTAAMQLEKLFCEQLKKCSLQHLEPPIILSSFFNKYINEIIKLEEEKLNEQKVKMITDTLIKVINEVSSHAINISKQKEKNNQHLN